MQGSGDPTLPLGNTQVHYLPPVSKGSTFSLPSLVSSTSNPDRIASPAKPIQRTNQPLRPETIPMVCGFCCVTAPASFARAPRASCDTSPLVIVSAASPSSVEALRGRQQSGRLSPAIPYLPLVTLNGNSPQGNECLR